MSRETAKQIADLIAKKPDALLCMAAGHTQRETLRMLVEYVAAELIDTSRTRWVSLDEWVGFGRGDAGSCIEFIDEYIFTPLHIGPEQYFFFDGKAGDLDAQCVHANAFIDAHGPIDLTVLGVGLNGHLGFNEPGADIKSRTYIMPLDETSQGASEKYFGHPVDAHYGITLGFKDLFAAGKVIVQCTGANKAEIVRRFIEGAVTRDVPVSLVRDLDHCEVFIDRDSASLLK